MRGNGATEEEIVAAVSKMTGRPAERAIRPFVIVLLPNNELCDQVWKVLNRLNDGCGTPLSINTFYGGGKYPLRDEDGNFTQVDIAIGTPGRMMDMVTKGFRMSSSHTKLVAMDETDALPGDHANLPRKKKDDGDQSGQKCNYGDGEDKDGKEHMPILFDHFTNANSNSNSNSLRHLFAGPSSTAEVVQIIMRFTGEINDDGTAVKHSSTHGTDNKYLIHIKFEADDGAATQTKLWFVNCKDPCYAPHGSRNPLAREDDPSDPDPPYDNPRDAAFMDILFDVTFWSSGDANFAPFFLCLADNRDDIHHMTEVPSETMIDKDCVRTCMGHCGKNGQSFSSKDAQDSLNAFISQEANILNRPIGFAISQDFSNLPTVVFYKAQDLKQV